MGSGFRTFASGEVLTSSNVQNYLMDQAVMVFAGTAARASALPSPEVGMTAYSTATGLQVYNGSAWVDVSTGYGVASGANSTATITVSGTSYTLLTFTSSGTLTVTKAGLFDVLMVGGGGSGGFRTTFGSAGGGGGGGVVEQTIYLNANATVTVGAKGAAVTNSGTTGNRGTFSRVGSLVAGGGAGGIGNDASGLVNGDAAGSGGGGIGSNDGFGRTTGGITLISTQGNNGGDGNTSSGTSGCGGGGGSTSVGANGGSTTGGNGGTGTATTTFTGATVVTHIGCGGGGAVGSGGTGGTAGNSSGGNGGVAGSTAGSNATSTFYGSGGGGGGATTSGAGSDGVVFVRFKV